jgi:hypothetical protein
MAPRFASARRHILDTSGAWALRGFAYWQKAAVLAQIPAYCRAQAGPYRQDTAAPGGFDEVHSRS